MTNPFTESSVIRQKNSLLEAAGLEWLGFRLPGLRVEAYFYYKLVEEPAYAIGIHRHEHWEMTRLVCGAASYHVQTEGGETSLQPDSGHFLLIPPGLPHRWELQRHPLLLNSWQIRCAAEDQTGEALLGRLAAKAADGGFLLRATPSQLEAESLLWTMTSEKCSPGVMGPMVSGIARIIIGSLVGSLRPWPQELAERDSKASHSSENLARKLKEFLEANLHHPINLVDLESHFHYSSRHLNRIFDQNFRCSIGQYLRERRFELATRWLATTNRSIKDIALSLGYGNISHFCRYFRKRQKLSPTRYRELSLSKPHKDTFSGRSRA